MNQNSFPGVPKELMDALDKAFPERCPDPAWSDREVWIATGQRMAVRFIIKKFNEQVKAAMEQKVKV